MARTSWWLQCQVSLGLFEHERLVHIENAAGDRVASLVVDRALVEEERRPGPNLRSLGRVRVEPLSIEGMATVALPTPSIEHGRVISIEAELLSQS